MLFVGTYRDEAPRVSCVSRGGDIPGIPLYKLNYR
jgi:hypothetical protein